MPDHREQDVVVYLDHADIREGCIDELRQGIRVVPRFDGFARVP